MPFVPIIPKNYSRYIRTLALAIIEDDKEKAKAVLAAIDKQIASDRFWAKVLLAIFIGIPLTLYVLEELYRLFIQK